MKIDSIITTKEIIFTNDDGDCHKIEKIGTEYNIIYRLSELIIPENEREEAGYWEIMCAKSDGMFNKIQHDILKDLFDVLIYLYKEKK
jgi:hypothetical protein